MEALTRQWAMLRNIPRWPQMINAPEMQVRLRELGYPTSLRTIQRDLVTLSTVFPLASRDGKPMGWFWPKHAPHFDTPGMDPMAAVTFTLVEKFLVRMLPPAAVSHLKPHFRAARGVLKDTRASMANWPNKVAVESHTFSLMAPPLTQYVVDRVYGALLHQRKFSCLYLKASPVVAETYEVNPLGLVFVDQTIYLVCTLDGSTTPVRLALHRIYKITPLDKAARTPAGFKISEYAGASPAAGTPGDARIQLKVIFDQATFFHLHETPMAEDQVVEELPDGRMLFTATVRDSPQLRAWLLGFGDHVEVVGPQALRKAMASIAKTMAKRYRDTV